MVLTSLAPLSSAADLAAKHARVDALLRSYGSLLIAFSGGVDSALLLKLAYDALGERAVGALAVSATIPQSEVAEARAIAAHIGVDLRIVLTEEMANAAFRQNDANRCYHCKTELFTVLRPLADELGITHIAYGINADDVGDHRPGHQAAAEWQVLGPLQEAGLHKPEIRKLARQLGLSVWNKPAMACLSSRIPHGQAITTEVLSMVEQAEAFIRGFGVRDLRVRTHEKTARIEVDEEGLVLLIQPDVRTQISAYLHGLGYRFVTLDLDGFRSGSTNAVNNPAH